MQSKKSFFNSTLYFKNLTRFWPVWGAYSLILFFMLPMSIFLECTSRYPGVDHVAQGMTNATAYITRMDDSYFPLILVFTIVAVVCVFSHLYNANATTFFRTIPMKAEGILFTGIVTVATMIVVPTLIMIAITAIVAGVNDVHILALLMKWFVVVLVQAFFLMSFAVICALVTGQKTAAGIFYIIMLMFIDVMSFPVQNLVSNFLFGFNTDIQTFLDKIAIASNLNGIADSDYAVTDKGYIVATFKFDITLILIFVAASLILYAVAFIIISRRKSEHAGDTIAIPFLRPVFRWGVGISAFFTGPVIAEFFFNIENRFTIAFIAVLFGLIGFVAAEMIMKKTFRVFKKKCVEILAFFACSIAFFICLEFDVFGVEKKIPEIKNVEAVELSFSYGESAKLTEAEDIEKIMELHKNIASHKTQIVNDVERFDSGEFAGSSIYVGIVYELKDGDSFGRRYEMVMSDEMNEYRDTISELIKIVNRPEFVRKTLLGSEISEDRIYSADITCFDEDLRSHDIKLDKELATELFKAVEKDIDEGHLRNVYSITERFAPDDKSYFIDLGFRYANGNTIVDDNGTAYDDIGYLGVHFTTECNNIENFLIENFWEDPNFYLATYGERYGERQPIDFVY